MNKSGGAAAPLIQTYTGIMVNPLAMTPGEIHLQDIAHALGNICRFTGHTSRFYSVAEHSINVCMVADYLMAQAPPDRICFKDGYLNTKLAALLHDANEAYLSDVCRPLKVLAEYAFYRDAEARLQTMIEAKYLGVNAPGSKPHLTGDPSVQKIVKMADDIMLGIEARDLMALSAPGDEGMGKNGKKITTSAQKKWDETWYPYLKLIPDDLYYRVSVAQAPSHKRNGERRAVSAPELSMGSEWLEMVRNLLAVRSPGVAWE